MLLGTFGAIITFALELENEASEYYERTFRKMFDHAGAQLLKGSKKRIDRLIRTRQELITEMILVPITDVDSDDYKLTFSGGPDKTDLLNQALQIEGNMLRFYSTTAPSIPMKEVQRVFSRLAIENQNRINNLNNFLSEN